MRRPAGFGTDMAIDQHQRQALGKHLACLQQCPNPLCCSLRSRQAMFMCIGINNSTRWQTPLCDCNSLLFLKPFTTAQCGGKYLLKGRSQGVTQDMTVTVGLAGNATTATRFIVAVLPNALNVEGKVPQNAPVVLFPHIAQFSAVRFQ